ncbi:MAG: SMI1/KNR4 family protein [Cyanothece sp. SIO1E1]|nr:SMI1/KNR4 family protein [Cyanothece sp. SIO1E1]
MNPSSLVASIERIRRKMAQKEIYLGKPLEFSELKSFEARCNILLPEDYRLFLLKIGDGGDGPPEYGLKRLTEAVTGAMQPSQLFPLSNCWVWEDEDELDENLLEAVYRSGFINLGTDGCGEDWILVVSGKAYGTIWQRSDVGVEPCVPIRSFISWYEHWLDGGKNWFDHAYLD